MPLHETPSSPSQPARDYPGKMLETTWSRFDWGALALVWSYGEALAHTREW
jgi:hypothetical protein